jgi:hypothetical protein
MCAFLNFRSERVPFCGGNTPRTRPNAVAATNALACLVDDRAIEPAIQRRRWARRGTRRFQAMQTPSHGEKVVQAAGCLLVGQLMKSDQGESICAESRRILKTQIKVQLGLLSLAIVLLLARNLTRTTADTLGDVDQSGLDGSLGFTLRHDLPRLNLNTSAEEPFALTTFTRQAFVS